MDHAQTTNQSVKPETNCGRDCNLSLRSLAALARSSRPHEGEQSHREAFRGNKSTDSTGSEYTPPVVRKLLLSR